MVIFRGADYWIKNNTGSFINIRNRKTTGSALNDLKRQGLARPFSETGPWNTPFTGGESWYDSAMLRTVTPDEQTQLGQPTNIRHWYMAEASVKAWYSTNSDPEWTFVMPTYIYTPFNRNRAASTFTFRCPANMVENQDDDHILVVINMDTGDMVEIWQAETTDSPLAEGLSHQANWEKQTLAAYTATNRIFGGVVAPGWARSNVMTDNGAGSTVSPPTGLGTNDGTRAANFSWLAGLLTQRDWDSSSIDHAIVCALGYVTLDNANMIAPATGIDNGGHSGPMYIGDRIGIPPGTSMPSFSPAVATLGAKVFTCLQTYGIYVGDFAGSAYPMLYCDSGMSDTTVWHPLFIWWDSFTSVMDALSPLLRVANRNPGA